jgi:hypothetical protein
VSGSSTTFWSISFYNEAEKPTQKVNAQRLGISIASYQERLDWAYKKLMKLFPEYDPKPRRNMNSKQLIKNKPAPLYQILENGERIEIPIPDKKAKS